MKTISCLKMGAELEALENAPYFGELGEKILNNISKEGWQAWLDYQTMLINENNLNLFDDKTQTYLKKQMEVFYGY